MLPHSPPPQCAVVPVILLACVEHLGGNKTTRPASAVLEGEGAACIVPAGGTSAPSQGPPQRTMAEGSQSAEPFSPRPDPLA